MDLGAKKEIEVTDGKPSSKRLVGSGTELSLLLLELDRKEHLKEKPGLVFQESFVGYT